ncbi:MAG: hypothetical protein BGO88_03725 [Flavobacterium sp. 38-13]|uniref:hypothetical protein n=1 Tax=Flavobacterium TaxID=237 RepID=UPI00095BC9D3|nr:MULTISPECIES: hypothetical protein [Flavobacterium]OJX51849.1 MAG: hypothetical protein BGO88_03725 [Flavobacterium sp. 38-13]
MKTLNIYFCLLFIGLSLHSFSQTGINTTNPLAALHVDPARNTPATGTPTTQQTDDFIVYNNTGNVGIGTVSPITKLHINNETANPSITITDGTQGVGKVLTSDANGVATWETPPITMSAVLGTFPTSSLPVTPTGDANSPIFSTLRIALKPGKWIVNVGLVFDSLGGATFIQNAYLSSSLSGAITQTNFSHLGPGGSNTSYIGVLTGSATFTPDTADNRRSFLTGSSIIQVTGSPVSIINLRLQNQPIGYYRFDPYAPENYFYAIPIN